MRLILIDVYEKHCLWRNEYGTEILPLKINNKIVMNGWSGIGTSYAVIKVYGVIALGSEQSINGIPGI